MPGSHKTSISLDADLMAKAERRADALGFGNSFSAYIAKLIRDDVASRPALDETPLPAVGHPTAEHKVTYRKSFRKPKAKVA
jgi:hypothetical protein